MSSTRENPYAGIDFTPSEDEMFYWVKSADGWAAGRSNSREMAISAARRIAKGFGDAIKVIANYGEPNERFIVEFGPGGTVIAGDPDAR